LQSLHRGRCSGGSRQPNPKRDANRCDLASPGGRSPIRCRKAQLAALTSRLACWLMRASRRPLAATNPNGDYWPCTACPALLNHVVRAKQERLREWQAKPLSRGVGSAHLTCISPSPLRIKKSRLCSMWRGKLVVHCIFPVLSSLPARLECHCPCSFFHIVPCIVVGSRPSP
jgi:hypothetical protein